MRLLLAGTILAAGLVAAEALVRSRAGVPLRERLPLLVVRANPLRGFEMVPGLHYTYRHAAHVNELGLRGEELGPRQPGETRVLAVGDSLVYGQGVGERQTLPAYLQQELRRTEASGRPWTVVNGGLRGYDTRQELGLIEELAPRVEPDVVVLFWYWNDLLEHPIPPTYARLSGSGPQCYDTGDGLDALSRLEWRARQLLRRSALVMFLHDRLRAALARPLEPGAAERGFQRLGRYLDRYQELAARHGFRPVVAIVPDPGRLGASSVTAALEERAARLARERGLPVIELLPPLRALTGRLGETPVLPYDGHYRPSANRCMAEAIARELLGLVQAPG